MEKDYESLKEAFVQLDDYSRAEIALLALVDACIDEKDALEYIAKQMDWNLEPSDKNNSK